MAMPMAVAAPSCFGSPVSAHGLNPTTGGFHAEEGHSKSEVPANLAKADELASQGKLRIPMQSGH